MTPKLGKLERVELREVWKGEATDFTPWLGNESNIILLGNVLDIELEVQSIEKNVGPFKADILCKDTGSQDEHLVLIENQLEKTDHTHMGQLITYAAGLDAVTIVWIAERFTDEHRAAMDWLNTITDEDFRFFGLEIELWKIGDSMAAPKFNIISSPNEWTKTGKTSKQVGQLSELKQMYLVYWSQFRELLKEQYPHIGGTKPRAQHWTTFSAGRSGFHTSGALNSQQKTVRAELNCSDVDALAYFNLLLDQKDEIESEIGKQLQWEELPNKKTSRISLTLPNADPTNESDWPRQHAWLAEYLDKFNKTLRPRIKALNAADWAEGIDEED